MTPQGSFFVAGFYRFCPVAAPETLQRTLMERCRAAELCGTIIVAEEGINGTVAGSRSAIDSIFAFLRTQPGLETLSFRQSRAKQKPFYRMKVRIKDEIVTLRSKEACPSAQVGRYVAPQDWNALISDPDVVVVDTRNRYEVRAGHFRGAIDPATESFTEFPTYADESLTFAKHRTVAMYCTGGIRCEKATSLLLSRGFTDVRHLKGGILAYLEEIPAAESLWEGECFVFDQRVALTHGLLKGAHSMCFACQEPLSPQECEHPAYEEGVSCPYCIDESSEVSRASARERMRQVRLAEERNATHIGASFEGS